MNYYQDLTLLPGGDIGISFIRNKVFNRIHKRLVDFKKADGSVPIALTFPNYANNKKDLGNKIRLLTEDKTVLEKYDLFSLVSIFSDYVHVTNIRSVPLNINGYVCFFRKQSNNNVERLAKRRAKRKGISFQEALSDYSQFEEQFIDLPFLTLKSGSTGETFKLFIDKKEAEMSSSTKFNTFGLSKGGAVPDF
ncbi:MAG: type I-F CRISPR-associated endoribonuclease Cas6/Csy4 [Candidatus Cloacimonetes bacterium]|nr:type I-F CRISPR-associated endoribonuclease Cas6/Csy4 [Candidatus Cloacimonadota bacterium]